MFYRLVTLFWCFVAPAIVAWTLVVQATEETFPNIYGVVITQYALFVWAGVELLAVGFVRKWRIVRVWTFFTSLVVGFGITGALHGEKILTFPYIISNDSVVVLWFSFTMLLGCYHWVSYYLERDS